MTNGSHTAQLMVVFVAVSVLLLIPSAMAANAAMLSLSASPSVVNSGEEVTLSGNLSDASTGVLIPMQTITLQSSPDGISWTPGWSTLSRTGQFQITRLMRNPGVTYFRVHFSGSGMYAAATSPPVTVTVIAPSGPKASALSLSASPRSLSEGGTVTLSGTLSAVPGGVGISGQSVVLSQSSDGVAFSPLGVVTTSQNGMYSRSIQMNTPGRFFFKAVYNGDSTYSGAESAVVVVDVTGMPQKATTLSIAASPASLMPGQAVNVTGILKESQGIRRLAGAVVTVQFSLNGSAWNTLGQQTTNGQGEYVLLHTPTTAGTYFYRSSYAGNTTYAPASSPTVNVTVKSQAGSTVTALSLAVSPRTLVRGGMVTVAGNLTAVQGGKGISGQSVIVSQSSDNLTFSPLAVVTTGTNGSYSTSTLMNTPGRFFFKAVYNGDSTYSGAESAVVVVDVTGMPQKATTLTIAASPASLTPGQAINVTGILKESQGIRRIPGAVVTVQFSLNGSAWSTLGQQTTNNNGEYLVGHTPPAAGTYQYRASYAGNTTYAPSTSPTVSVTVKSPSGLQASALSLNVTPRSVAEGGVVTFAGNLTAVQGGNGILGQSVIVSQSSDNLTFSPLAVVTTGTNGSYSTSTQVNTPGRFFFKAIYNGDSTYSGAESAVVAINVTGTPQKATTLTIAASSASLTLGQAINVTGVLKESQGIRRIPGAVVTVQFSLNGSAWSTLGQQTTNDNGEYLVGHTPPAAGTYQYRAAYAGNTTYAPSTSPTVSVTVAALPPVHATTLSIQATPPSPSRGETYVITGILRDSSTGKGVTGKVVRVERSTDGINWSLVSLVITRTDGDYSTSQVQSAGGRFSYRAMFNGDRSYKGSTSPVIHVTIKRVSDVSLTVSPVVIAPGGTVHCSGKLVDAKSGAALAGETVKVMISQENTSWTTFGTAATVSDGAWNLSAKIPNAGSYYLAARYEGSAYYDGDWSNSVGIRVK